MSGGHFYAFFDLDGTLTEPAPGITACLAHALRSLGRAVPPPAELQRHIGPPLRDSFAELLGSNDAALIEQAVAAYRARFSTIGLFENTLYPGIEGVLAELLDAGFRLAVVTSKPEVYARRILEHFGIGPCFVNVYGAELSGERSSKLELVAHALRGESLPASDACMIGDRAYDVSGGRGCGVRTIGVTWGYGTAEELREAGADALVDAVSELPAACRSLRASAASR